jgi:hypothetical protein
MIRNSVFSDLGTPANGAAICTTSVNFEVVCCRFELNRVSQNGGSIYFKNGTIKVSRCLFFKCYSTAHADNKYYGNAIFVDSNEANIEETSTRLSGISDSECTDSCISISNCKTTLFLINATHNYGIGGASICRVFRSSSGSKFSYLQGCENKDDNEIESWENEITIERSNFINITDKVSVFWENSNDLIECISCVFWNMNNKVLSSHSRISCINCTSNNDTSPSLTKIDLFEPNPVFVRNDLCNSAHTCNNQRRIIGNFFFFVQIISS